MVVGVGKYSHSRGIFNRFPVSRRKILQIGYDALVDFVLDDGGWKLEEQPRV
jgi:hypothetical protein